MIWLLLQTEPVQNFIVGKTTAFLSKELKTTVEIDHVSFVLFNKMDLDKMLIRDRRQDTLLYAGSVRVRITDWFFLRSKADLKYIGLEDAVIHQQRKDSTWNFQFLIDYFSTSKQKDTTNKIELDIQKVDLKNVVYVKTDEWLGNKLIIKTMSMVLDAEKMDFVQNQYAINTITLDKPYFISQRIQRNKKDTATVPVRSESAYYFNNAGIEASIKSLTVKNGYFALQNGKGESKTGQFDGTNIRIAELNGTINNFAFFKDTISAAIDLAGIERSGFTLKQLKANFKLTPRIMEFNELTLATNKSRLSNYYSMNYKNFNKDFANFLTQVQIKARLQNAVVSSDDIAYFAPALQSWNQRFSGNILFNGTVSDFSVNNMFLRNSASTYVSGNFSMKGLPDINNTQISLTNGRIQTNSREIAFLIPAIKNVTTPNLAALGNLKFQGNFNGTYQNFIAKGNLSSALGGMYTDLRLDFTKNQPVYRGNIQTTQFDLGKFLLIKDLGNVGFTGKVEGSSFDLNKLYTTVNGEFNRLEFNNYTYSNIAFDGSIERKKFSGELKSDDENFNFTSSVEIDLSGETPRINLVGDLEDIKLQPLNFSKENFEITGLFDLNFSGKNIDEFIGSAKIFNAIVTHNDVSLDFDSLTVQSYRDFAGEKVLSAESNEFNVSVRGKYNILDLPGSFQSFLSEYFPSIIAPPRSNPGEQAFVLTVNTRDFDSYARLIDSNLSGFGNMSVVGRINTVNTKSFAVNAHIPFARYQNYTLENALIAGEGSYDSLIVEGDVEKIYLKDSFYFPNTFVNIRTASDHSDVHIATSANNTLDAAELNADVFTLKDGVRINFQPSSFILNDKQWNLEEQGEIIILKQSAFARNVKFTQGFQEISFETVEEEGDTTSNLVARLKNVNLGDFTPLFLRKPLLEGVANGDIYLRDFYGEFNLDANIRATEFRMDYDSVGIVDLLAAYRKTTGRVSFSINSDNENYDFNADGTYDITDSTNSPLHTTLVLNETKIDFLNQFLGTLFSNVTGYATGNLLMRGKINEPHITGDALLENGALTVNFTQVRYTIDSAFFRFKENQIDFGRIYSP